MKMKEGAAVIHSSYKLGCEVTFNYIVKSYNIYIDWTNDQFL